MSVFVDEFVNGQVVHVDEIENHFTRMEVKNEILYLRVNSTMLKPKMPVVTRANVTVQVSKPTVRRKNSHFVQNSCKKGLTGI